MDVDTRLLRYFAAVAEEGNLTRAAERLFVSRVVVADLAGELGVDGYDLVAEPAEVRAGQDCWPAKY